MTQTPSPASESPFVEPDNPTGEPAPPSADMVLELIGRDPRPASELVVDEINPANPHLFSQHTWHEHFARLRREDPVHLNEIDTAGRYWSVTRYDDVRAVDADWETYSSAYGIIIDDQVTDETPHGMGGFTPFIAMDPPEHTAPRRTVRPVSTPRNLKTLEPFMRQRTAEVLEGLPVGETFDWVNHVSIELTTSMLAHLFDFPMEERAKLTRWSDIIFAVPMPGGIVESIEQKLVEIEECYWAFERLWQERLENPGDDLVSMLAHGEETKHQSLFEHLGTIMLLIVGGNDTTRNTMSGSVYGLNRFPEQYDRLQADHSLIDQLVPEILRWQTPLAYMRRTATRDCELGGKQIQKHDQILMWYLSANRDEEIFPDGDAIDLSRDNAFRHLSFGSGIHYCIGARMAELQLRILWEQVLDRFERIEVQAEPERTLSSFVNGYTSLPVKIRRRRR